jgi:hypothetical protein
LPFYSAVASITRRQITDNIVFIDIEISCSRSLSESGRKSEPLFAWIDREEYKIDTVAGSGKQLGDLEASLQLEINLG